jgi:hypothetical protein
MDRYTAARDGLGIPRPRRSPERISCGSCGHDQDGWGTRICCSRHLFVCVDRALDARLLATEQVTAGVPAQRQPSGSTAVTSAQRQVAPAA